MIFSIQQIQSLKKNNKENFSLIEHAEICILIFCEINFNLSE